MWFLAPPTESLMFSLLNSIYSCAKAQKQTISKSTIHHCPPSWNLDNKFKLEGATIIIWSSLGTLKRDWWFNKQDGKRWKQLINTAVLPACYYFKWIHSLYIAAHNMTSFLKGYHFHYWNLRQVTALIVEEELRPTLLCNINQESQQIAGRLAATVSTIIIKCAMIFQLLPCCTSSQRI